MESLSMSGLLELLFMFGLLHGVIAGEGRMLSLDMSDTCCW